MKTFQKKGDCLDLSHECLISCALFSLIHKKVKPKCQLEVEHRLWHKTDSQTKHFTYGRGQKESTILFSAINENHIQETGSETCSFNALAVSWQVAILDPFKARGYWTNLQLEVLTVTVSIKHQKWQKTGMVYTHVSYALMKRLLQDVHLRNPKSWSRTCLKWKDFKLTNKAK